MRKIFSALTGILVCSTLIGQDLTLNASYSDTLHTYLLKSNLTHYSIYFKDSLVLSWQDPECKNETVNTASLMKSITGLGIGQLLKYNFIDSLNEPVCNYIPEWEAGCTNNVTIKHLLTMTSGIRRKPHAERVKFFTTDNWNNFVLKMTLDTIPGSQWAYSNEAGQLIEPIIKKASGMDVQDFFDKYLFKPLGMNHTKLLKDPSGNYSTIGGASTQIKDLANMGIAVLNYGKFNGVQVLDSSYLDAVFTPISQNPYYGYLWWLDTEQQAWIAMGDGGVYMFVHPQKNLVFVRSNNCKKEYDPMKWRGSEYIETICKIVKE